MPSLKDLNIRIGSVKSTQKITSAMKMVAASKLRRAQEQVEAGRPYAERMERMLAAVSAGATFEDGGPRLLRGSGKSDVHLVVVITSDRGLCGGFNGSIIREARRQVASLRLDGRTVKLLCVGRKGRDALRREYSEALVESFDEVGRNRSVYADSQAVAARIISLFDAKEFDVCTVIYNQFKSVISQIVTVQQLIPVPPPAREDDSDVIGRTEPTDGAVGYEFEPDEATVLEALLPRNLVTQVYRAVLESMASEQGARMSAMDNATRNAGEMIGKLTLTYNRTRQAYITKELIEIISGAEAL